MNVNQPMILSHAYLWIEFAMVNLTVRKGMMRDQNVPNHATMFIVSLTRNAMENQRELAFAFVTRVIRCSMTPLALI